MGKRKGGGLPRGFVSKAQWRFFFGSKNPKLRALARKEAHKAQAAGGGPKIAYHKLPGHVKGRTRRR